MQFLFVYIREAHPTDEWQHPRNPKEGVEYRQPRSAGERREVAQACRVGLSLTLPVVVDRLDDRVERQYAAWPERIFGVGRDGRVAYASAHGPWGFKPERLRRWLERSHGRV